MATLLRRAFTSELYLTVLVAIVLGTVVGLVAPDAAASLEPLGDPVHHRDPDADRAGRVLHDRHRRRVRGEQLASVGRVGVKALVYFEVMTTIALIVGLVVMDTFHPGTGLNANPDDLQLSSAAKQYVGIASGEHWYDFLIAIVPESTVGAFTGGSVLQVLFVSLVFAIALRQLGERGQPIADAIERIGEVVFGMVKIVMYLAPIGAFGGMAFAVGKFGIDTLTSLASFVGLVWVTGIVFSLVAFGAVMRICGLNVLKLSAT